MNINMAQICGRITADLTVKEPKPDFRVLSFGVASNRSWKDKAGNKQQETEFHNVVSFGNQGDTIAKWFSKGDEIYIQGRLRTHSWEDQQGVKKYKTEIIVEKWEFGQKLVKKETAQPEGQYKGEIPVEEAPAQMVQDVDINSIPF